MTLLLTLTVPFFSIFPCSINDDDDDDDDDVNNPIQENVFCRIIIIFVNVS